MKNKIPEYMGTILTITARRNVVNVLGKRSQILNKILTDVVSDEKLFFHTIHVRSELLCNSDIPNELEVLTLFLKKIKKALGTSFNKTIEDIAIDIGYTIHDVGAITIDYDIISKIRSEGIDFCVTFYHEPKKIKIVQVFQVVKGY